MRLKIDENLPAEAAEVLRSAGHDAATVFDQRIQGKGDQLLVDTCKREGRVLVTLDRGFGDIRMYPPEQSAGLIVLDLHRQHRPHILAMLSKTVELLAEETVERRLWIVDESRVRVRGEARQDTR